MPEMAQLLGTTRSSVYTILDSREKVKNLLKDANENGVKLSHQAPTLYDVVPKEEIAEFEELMRKTIADIASEASSVACWVYVQICETENSGRNAARIARSRPVYYCHGYLVRKTDGGIIEAMIEWRKRFDVQLQVCKTVNQIFYPFWEKCHGHMSWKMIVE